MKTYDLPERPRAQNAFVRTRPSLRVLSFGCVLLVVNRLSSFVLPYSSRFFVDRVLISHRLSSLRLILLAILAAVSIQVVTTYLLNRFVARAALKMIAAWRIKVRGHLLKVPVQFYARHQTGELVSRVMRDLDGVRSLFGAGMIELLGGILNSLLAIIIMFSLDAELTIWVLVALVGFLAFLAVALPPLRRAYQDQAIISGELSGQLSESISGIYTVKVYCGEHYEAQRFQSGVQRLLVSAMRAVMHSENLSVLAGVVLGLTNCGVMYVVAHQVISARLTVGTFVSYATFLGMMSAPILQIAGMGAQCGEALTGFKRAREILAEQEDTQDSPKLASCPTLRGNVRFDNVSFNYEENVEILRDISFEALPGSMTAIVGASGAGKSTIVNLLAGFAQPTTGQIFVDGLSLRTLNVSTYRRQIAIVLQDTFLFDGSLRDNILYGKPGAAEQELRAAARTACVDEFAEQLPHGYATRVGERGIRLSGGQKQRVAIARALLADPRLLLLDEGSSNLDAETEASVQRSLTSLFADRTVFTVAHRLTTIHHANQILVLERGRIVEHGVHEDLIRANGKYCALYAAQLNGRIEAMWPHR
jgi:ABC-type bacteriocin/lantibiotic exporter with double-glycine peptidase domain